jgi:hypothetical protein
MRLLGEEPGIELGQCFIVLLFKRRFGKIQVKAEVLFSEADTEVIEETMSGIGVLPVPRNTDPVESTFLICEPIPAVAGQPFQSSGIGLEFIYHSILLVWLFDDSSIEVMFELLMLNMSALPRLAAKENGITAVVGHSGSLLFSSFLIKVTNHVDQETVSSVLPMDWNEELRSFELFCSPMLKEVGTNMRPIIPELVAFILIKYL